MARQPSTDYSKVFTLAVVSFTIAVLYFAREVLVPFALAVLLSFLLSPLVTRLERWKLGRIPSVVIVVFSLFLVLGLFGWVVTDQLISLGNNFDSYQGRIETRLKDIAPGRGGILGKAQEAIDELSGALFDSGKKLGGAKSPPTPASAVAEGEPLPVEIVQKVSPLTYLTGMVGGVLGALATGGAVILLVFFILISREDMRNRLIRLIGPGQISVTTQAMHDAGKRVSRYLLMQLIVNASYGLVVAIGLYFIGLPNAVLWGVLAAVLRYIPYLGPWIAACIPLLLSLAVFDGWSPFLYTVALFVVLELISNNVMEPLLYGSSTGISTVGLLVAAVFWTWLWGAVGLVMATPLTVCIAVLGRYVPKLEFFNVLLSDEPVLSAAAQYYQRLLAADDESALAMVVRAADEKPLEEVFDEILLPALALIERDVRDGHLTDVQQDDLHDTIREAIEDAAERHTAKLDAAVLEGEDPGAKPSSSRCVLCLPARDMADELAGLMLCEVLESRGVSAQNVSTKVLASEMVDKVDEGKFAAVCVSAVPPYSISHARYLCKRIRARNATVKVVVGLWHTNETIAKGEARLKSYATRVCATLHDAVEQL